VYIHFGFSTRRHFTYRSFSGSKYAGHDDIDLEEGKLEKDRVKTKPVKIQNQALPSGFAFCVLSCSMILVNKYVLSGYDFSAGISLMLYQVKLTICHNYTKINKFLALRS